MAPVAKVNAAARTTPLVVAPDRWHQTDDIRWQPCRRRRRRRCGRWPSAPGPRARVDREVGASSLHADLSVLSDPLRHTAPSTRVPLVQCPSEPSITLPPAAASCPDSGSPPRCDAGIDATGFPQRRPPQNEVERPTRHPAGGSHAAAAPRPPRCSRCSRVSAHRGACRCAHGSFCVLRGGVRCGGVSSTSPGVVVVHVVVVVGVRRRRRVRAS